MQTSRNILTQLVTLTIFIVLASTSAPFALASEAKKAQTSATDGVFLQEAHSDVLFEVLVDRLAKSMGSEEVRKVAKLLANKGMQFDREHIGPTAKAVSVTLSKEGEDELAAMTRLSPYQAILYNDLRTREGEEFNTAALNALLFVNQVWMGQAMALIRFGRVAQVRGVAEVACEIAKSNIEELHKLMPPVAPTSKW